MGKRRVNFQRCWLPVSRIGLHRRGVERVNCGPKLLDLGEKGVYSSYTCRVPGGDYEGYVDAHVRRLEALRRAGIVERIDADQWRIPDDLVSRAAAHDAGRDSQASVRVLSPVDLNKQIGSDGATLRQPASGNKSAKPWTSAASTISNRATPPAAGTAASSTGATFSPSCGSAR